MINKSELTEALLADGYESVSLQDIIEGTSINVTASPARINDETNHYMLVDVLRDEGLLVFHHTIWAGIEMARATVKKD